DLDVVRLQIAGWADRAGRVGRREVVLVEAFEARTGDRVARAEGAVRPRMESGRRGGCLRLQPIEPGLVADQVTVGELVPDQSGLVAGGSPGDSRPGKHRREHGHDSENPEASTQRSLLRDRGGQPIVWGAPND